MEIIMKEYRLTLITVTPTTIAHAQPRSITPRAILINRINHRSASVSWEYMFLEIFSCIPCSYYRQTVNRLDNVQSQIISTN